ncbi:Zn(II)2Cys6 transcription factor [Aspergillus foveolatus]|uniref:Zn(II)2Cys6 transcription factor n=1 Tax=Aspergillus foveolatus TaxID=210207 RepID=UPI003CCC9972
MPRREIAPGRSCFECRRRKIKCDRSHPCSYCVKVRINCKYPALRRAGEDHDALSRVASLESKIVALEKRLAEVEEPSLSRSEPGSKPSARYGGNNRSQDTEYSEARVPRIQGEGAMHDPPSSPPAATAGTRSSMLLRPQAAVDLGLSRPTPSTIAALWQRYLEIVDPVLKIFHTPTVQTLVFQAIQGRDKLDLASECLLFAIYYATVAAMAPSNHKSPILTITNRQITGRNDPDGPDVYALVGLAIGMALKMGLNQDGEAQGYPQFEVEIRRRLWWQLFTLDIRVAEDRGSEPCILESSFNTRLPSNVADTTLHPAMTRPPRGQGRTEMLFSLVRFEGSYFARQMVFSERFRADNSYAGLSSNEARHAIELFQERIEKQYLEYCDESVPLDRVIVQSIRLILAKLRLVAAAGSEAENTVSKGRASACSARSWAQILQDAEALRGYAEGKQWLWLFQTYIEWDGLAHLLQHFWADPPREEEEHWELANRVYSHWKKEQSFQRDGRWKAIQDLWSEVLERWLGPYTT